MVGQPIAVGPFNGGLNTKSDPSALADNELAICENFEVDFDGSLRTRPPFAYRGTTFPLGTTGDITVLGWFQRDATHAYLVASDGLHSTYSFDGTSWSLITNTIAAADAQQYEGKLYLVAPPGASSPSGTWNGSTFTADSNMPKGTAIATYKGRLFIATGGTTLTVSTAYTAPPPWSATNNTVDIGYGDGESIVAIVNLQNVMLVFRTHSIWSYSYASDPAGFIAQTVSPNIGLDSITAIEQFENDLYFVFEGHAYQLSNGRVNQLNEKVPFVATGLRTGYGPAPVAVSVLNRRVIFSFYDVLYVYSTETNTWCTWRSTVYGGIGKLYQRSGYQDAYPVAYAFPSGSVAPGSSRSVKTLFITDTVTSEAENFTATMQTKDFDYQSSSQYKRLFWWGVDAVFRQQLTAVASPVAYRTQVTWGQLRAASTWSTALNFTWGQPLTPSMDVVTVRDATGSGPIKKFVKLSKSLRFRQIHYRVSILTDGSVGTAPVKVFDIQTFVSLKERVVEPIS